MKYLERDIVVLGLASSGIETCRFLATHGAHVTGVDQRMHLSETEELTSLGVKLIQGNNESEPLDNADLIIVSPGVPPTYPGLQKAMDEGRVASEMEIARKFITSPVITVSGTNGKTTTVHLITHLLKNAGMKICLAGNVGRPLIGVIDEANASDFVVVEISSFQLMYSKKFESNIGVLLNITPDHLDWHKNLDEYESAKAKLAKNISNDGYLIYNADDELVANIAKKSGKKLLPFSRVKTFEENGAYFENKKLIFNFNGKSINISTGSLKIEGTHNYENSMASGLVFLTCMLEGESLEGGFMSFLGLPHRIEFIREMGGVRFFNDSKGTNVGAAIAALKGFDSKVVLIAGGQEKGTPWDDLVMASKDKVKHAILIGEAADSLNRALSGVTKTSFADDMNEAVKNAFEIANDGDIVLLSPACASFDMFKNYADRGNAFKNAVEKL